MRLINRDEIWMCGNWPSLNKFDIYKLCEGQPMTVSQQKNGQGTTQCTSISTTYATGNRNNPVQIPLNIQMFWHLNRNSGLELNFEAEMVFKKWLKRSGKLSHLIAEWCSTRWLPKTDNNTTATGINDILRMEKHKWK